MKSSASLCIANACIISPDAVIPSRWLFVRDGIIKKTGKGRPPPAEKTINARGNYVAAGCIDLHLHGESTRASSNAAAGGTAGFVRSLCAADTAQLCAIINRETKIPLAGARRLGYHLEGPFLNPAMAGAQPVGSLRRPNMRWVRYLLSRCGRDIRIMTLAPELYGSSAVIRSLRRQGIVAGLGHSLATYEEAVTAIKSGASLATHCYNRMSTLSSRLPGLVTAVLLDDRITAEIICDGKHVHPALIQLLVRVKPRHKVVLVTDSVSAEPELCKRFRRGVYRLADGTIAGSCLTMLAAIRNIIQFTGISLPQAVAMATVNPARVLGLEAQKGKIKPGFDADLVMFDKNFNCLKTIVGGRIVFQKSEDRGRKTENGRRASDIRPQ